MSDLDTIQTRVAHNLKQVRSQIYRAAIRAGRDPAAVTLVAVTKSVGIPEMEALLAEGVRHFGENRIDVAAAKIAVLPDVPIWHFIGSIQRRKVREIVTLCDHLDAVDRLSLAERVSQRCVEAGRSCKVLLQVNVSGEASKQGFSPEEVPQAFDEIRTLPGIEVTGLMTMAPFVADPEEARSTFRGLHMLAEQLGLTELSMGMSNDFEVAVEEGATQVRIGSALFA